MSHDPLNSLQHQPPVSGSINLRQLLSVDRRPIESVAADALDENKTREHIARAVERGRYQGPREVVEYWRANNCLALHSDGAWYATIAGIICFGKAPQAWFPNAVVTLVKYKSPFVHSDQVEVRERVRGTIFEQVKALEEFLLAQMQRVGMRLKPNTFEREDVPPYPWPAVREAFINMVLHRDYEVDASADVNLFPSHMILSNPGGLLPGITLELIRQIHQSRNPAIANILRQAGLCEEAGQGIDTIYREYAGPDVVAPLFEDLRAFFRVTLFGRGYETGPYVGCSARQKAILGIIRANNGERTKTDHIVQKLHQAGDLTEKRQVIRDINELLRRGLLRKEGASRQTAYCLTDMAHTEERMAKA